MTEDYIRRKTSDILKYTDVVEHRADRSVDMEDLVRGNSKNLKACKAHGYPYILMDKEYHADIR